MNTTVMVLFGLLACVGFVQTLSWLAVYFSRKGNRVYRVVPVGGIEKNAGDQMALMYACLQWEANPARQVTILYNVGLDEREIADCRELTRGAGVYFAETAADLAAFITYPEMHPAVES